MAIDIRATVTCSLGTLISGTISDDYIQGSGLVKTRGSIELSGIVTPAVGTAVTFSYTKGGVTRSIPRMLRVMSSFADPFRRTTKVELGCQLTYLSDLQEPVDWTAFDDPENAEFTSADAEIVTVPIHASSVMDKCLTELGLTASSNPLTNKFSIATFDFSAGYVSVLSDLLVSESYCAYLDADEVLQVFSLDEEGGTGPVIDSTAIIDLGGIGVGQLPGEDVTVRYSTLKLNQPDAPIVGNEDSENANSIRLWEREETTVFPANTYSVGPNTYTGIESTVTETTYDRIGSSDLPVKRVTSEYGSTAKIAGAIGTAYATTEGIGFNAITTELRREEEIITYDSDGNLVQSESTQYEQALAVFGGVSLTYVFSASDYVPFNYGLLPTGKRVTKYKPSGNVQQETTSSYTLWSKTIPGQQAISEYRESLTTSGDVSAFVNAVSQYGLVHEQTVVSINSVGEVAARPDDVLNNSYADGGDPNNGYRTDSTAELELALGSATAQRRVEFSMPYAPDDTFIKNAGPPVTYSAVASDAAEKAAKYGRVQNLLLLGNRSGMNLQLAPETLPDAPFSPIVVQADGLSALYRVNGTNWQLSSDGVLVSTDALFWGAVGGTGTFWFPVAPGITTLPTTPPVTSGSMTVTNVVPVWNETVLLTGTLRVGVSVRSLPYALDVLTGVPAYQVRLGVVVARVKKLEVSAAPISFAGQAPRVGVSAAVRPPTAAVNVAALAPAIHTGTSVTVPAVGVIVAAVVPVVATGSSVAVPTADVSVAGLSPVSAGPPPALLNVPATEIAIVAMAPQVQTGSAVTVPIAEVLLSGVAPAGVGNIGSGSDMTVLVEDDLLSLLF